jgi:hypothetical protein
MEIIYGDVLELARWPFELLSNLKISNEEHTDLVYTDSKFENKHYEH